MLERQLVLETSYQLDGTAGLTMLVVRFDINSITNTQVRHFKRFAVTPLKKVTMPQLGNTHIES